MTKIDLNKYGKVLTGRAFGKDITKEILSETKPPYILNFKDVISMGSSFGDELVPALAKTQIDPIQVINANLIVLSCIKKVETDAGITVKIIQ